MTTYPASFASDELLARVSANLARVRERIGASGRDPDGVRIVAVTKTFGVPEVRAAYEVGLRNFGENYVDELCAKSGATSDLALRWHYLGALQSNKIARCVTCAQVLSGLARDSEARKIVSLAGDVVVDVQVDFTKNARRNGVAPGEVAPLVRRARELGLHVRGLMLVAPTDLEQARDAFRATVALADELELVERSMGMSDDVEMACELGSTEVRLGRALFGSRMR